MSEGEAPYLLVTRAQWKAGSSLKDRSSDKDRGLSTVGRGGTQIVGLALHPVR